MANSKWQMKGNHGHMVTSAICHRRESLTLNLISLIRHPLVFKDHGTAPEKSDLLGTMSATVQSNKVA